MALVKSREVHSMAGEELKLLMKALLMVVNNVFDLVRERVQPLRYMMTVVTNNSCVLLLPVVFIVMK